MAVQLSRERHAEIIKKQNVLSVGIAEKIRAGAGTGIEAVVVYVSKKVAAADLASEHLVPAEVDGVPTDVVELAADYLGETAVAKMHPDDVKKLLGLKPLPPKATELVHRDLAAPANASDWSGFAGPVANQMQCGCCVAEGCNGCWETMTRIAANDPNLAVLFSVILAFFCSGGTCGGGNTVEAYLNYCQTSGNVPDKDCPWNGSPAEQGSEMTCQQGCVTGWQQTIEKLGGYNAITDPNEALSLMDKGVLVITLSVHQSFLSYTGPGVYKNLGAGDPVIGGHCMFMVAKNISAAWRALKNSWDVTWGQKTVINGVARPGFCLIDPAELDPTLYELVLAVPTPPTPTGSVPMSVSLSDLDVTPAQPLAGMAVVITVTRPDGSTSQVNLTTDASGTAATEYSDAQATGYKAQAAFAGIAGKYAGCVSDVQTFEIAAPAPPPAPPAPTEHATGITLKVG